MQKITPHLWFDKQAEEAADFYASIFKNSKIGKVARYGKAGYEIHKMPEGTAMTVEFELEGYTFMALNAGPVFKFNPSVSFMVNFDPSQDSEAKKRIDVVWAKLSEGGKILMPLQKYPFSEWYGWVEDRYGVSWQLILTNPEGEERPTIIPSFLFVKDVYGKAEEASDFYLSIFKNSKRGAIAPYGAGQEPDKEGAIMFTEFKLEGQWFAAMDSAREHDFAFNEAISFMVHCDTQEEIDYYWEKLSANPASEQCGWLKDKYGISWQIVPTILGKLMSADPKKSEKVMETLLQMKKLDIRALKQAYEQA